MEPVDAVSGEREDRVERQRRVTRSTKLGFGFWPFGSVEYTIEDLTNEADEARRERKSYVEKLEEADRDNVFKYVLLINVAALEQYVAQTRIQAHQSFQLSKAVAAAGFLLLGIGIGLGVYFRTAESGNLDAAYLSASAGALTEFISGVFFYLYNRTLHQLNRFHDRLIATQQIAMSFLASDLVTDEEARNQSRLALAKDLMAKVGPPP
jgi:hypothetical protein